ncbi:MAG TPA: cadmium-containing carbonic anhydrase [Candidatus Saccharimonadales bacterium]|nr:cadmium-containing carbonic anhydrase [Candidatus Saccharimonadales bacterium]
MEHHPKDTDEMEQKVAFMELGDAAIGTIEAGQNQQERLEEFTERVGRGEFHKEITNGVTIPVRCVDGRNIPTGAHSLAPNAAGGTESIFVADDLTTKRFAGYDDSTVAGYTAVVEMLTSNGYEVGGHTDSHAHDEISGCGANDKLPQMYQYISERGDTLRSVASQLGIDIADDVHNMIVDNATQRTEFSSGAELLSVLEANAKEEFVDHLDGEHNEVVLTVCTRPGVTLDRDTLQAAFGSDYEAFNVDVWSFEQAARLTSENDEEVAQKIAAMTYYNLATAFVLAGPRQRVTVIE